MKEKGEEILKEIKKMEDHFQQQEDKQIHLFENEII
jgi:hypothetical protein